MILLILAAAVCALVQGWIVDTPDFDGSNDPWAVSVEQAMNYDSVIWVDARSEKAFTGAHLGGAIRLDPDGGDEGLFQILSLWDPGSTIIVYCDGNGCESSKAIAKQLRAELGSESVFWLVGGWPALQEAGAVP
ncbi:MAG TPA: rhodanese-like domain-containing protein [Oceanipulchritudo sp.]|nr:rhodanese-like domain-containing protein [Oceanipulchritudo sp.]